MAWYRAGGGGIPSSLKTDMNDVLNKKFGTSQDYPPADWAPTVNLMGPLPEKTASGAIVTFADGADEVPIKSWEVEIAPTLTGKSTIECTQTGKNIWSWDSSLTIVRDKSYSGIKIPTGTYTLSFDFISSTADPAPTTMQIAYATSDGTKYNPVTVVQGRCERTFTLAYDATAITIYSASSYSASVGVTTVIQNIQLEIGSVSPTTFEPYSGTTHTATLGRTIYGGQADVVAGHGSGEWVNVKLKDLTWYYSTSYGGFFHSPSIQSVVSDETYICVSDEYTNVRLNSYQLQNTDDAIGINADNGSAVTGGAPLKSIVVKDTDYTTVADLIAHFTANDSTLCYKLATAETFTFTPITPTPETALGVNNFWADEGDSEVTYRADINLALGGQ